MGRSFLVFLAVLVVFLEPGLFGQNGSPSQPGQSEIVGSTQASPAATDNDGQIRLDVQVEDRTGAPVHELQKQDFTILDDKQPQNILAFRAVDGRSPAPNPPVEVVLVVDSVNAPFGTVTYEREEIKKFLLQNDGKLALPVSLIVFSDTGTKIQNGSSQDGKSTAALLDQYETGLRIINRSQGFYGAEERLDLSLKTLGQLEEYERTRPGRKLVVWISPGWPILSGPNVQLTNKEEQQLFHSIVAASDGLRQARITLYSIDPLGLADAGGSRTTYYEEFLKGVTSPSRALPGNLALQVLATQSGGRVFYATNDLASAISNCTQDANAFYVLSFNARRADRPNEYHSININIDKPGIKARTRAGYYAQP